MTDKQWLKVFSPINMMIAVLAIGAFFFLLCLHNEGRL